MLKGNFRPLGRFIFYLEEAARFDLAAALGVPPHVVQGAIRVEQLNNLSRSRYGAAFCSTSR